jgi:type III pantothenate kinase
MNILAVDIGNTSVSAALVRGGRVGRIHRMATRERSKQAIRQFLEGVVGKHLLVGTALCSVVPGATGGWRQALCRICGAEPVVLTARTPMDIRIRYPKPDSIGPDRLANACGAVARYGAPVIVADFGTALTFDVVSADRAYVGGVIAPGLSMMTDYLADRTALLPHANLRGPFGPVGKSTIGAMRIGAKIGYRGMVREIVTYLRDRMSMEGVALCATGGFAEWALDGLHLPFHVDPDLTLYGLYTVLAGAQS